MAVLLVLNTVTSITSHINFLTCIMLLILFKQKILATTYLCSTSYLIVERAILNLECSE